MIRNVSAVLDELAVVVDGGGPLTNAGLNDIMVTVKGFDKVFN